MKTKYRLPRMSLGSPRHASFIFPKDTGSCHCLRLLISLLLVFLVEAVSAQEQVVTGKITDAADGQPLPGVNVALKGSPNGTITDVDGHYKISLSGGEQVLTFSFVGMKTHEESVGQRGIIDVSLEPDNQQLSEIVVTGTGVPTEKRKLAFAVESTTTDKLPAVPTASIDQALVGRIAGAQISSINGTPGSEVSILLRGINSLNRGTQPMIMVDGVQMGATLLSSIDPNSIERVEVIQGAAAATIYGAQGANGVIQLFTKRGKSGNMKLDFSVGIASNELLNVGGLRKAQLHGFATNANNEVINPGTGIPLTQDPATLVYSGNVGLNLLNPSTRFEKPYDQNLQYVDHFKMFFKAATTTNYRLAVSGGSEKMDYNISLSKMKQESNFRGDGYNDRTNLTVNLGAELAKGLRLRSITQLIYNENTINIFEKQDYGLGTIFYYLLNTRPFADFSKKNIDGDYGANFGQAAGVNQFNPFYNDQYSSSLDKKVDILQNLNLTYSLSRHVDVDLLYGINYQTRNFRNEFKNQSLNQNSNKSNQWTSWSNNVDNTGEITEFDINRTFQNAKATANIHFDFDKDLQLRIPIKSSTQIAYDYRSDHLSKRTTYALGMPLTPPLTATQGTTFNIPEDYKEDFVTFGYLVNQRFEYKDIVGISGGFRSDYSSSFGKGSTPFTFPRADGYLRLSSLNSWDNTGISKTIIDWKLRAAYGEAGIQPRPFDRYITLGAKPLGNTSALYIPTNLNNPNLNVEVSKEFEAGTDILIDGLKGNWLRNFQFTLSYWTRRTDNAIWQVDAPPSTGVSTVLDNALSLKSNGIQASVLISVLKSSKWSWNLTTNFSKQQSLVAAVKGDTIIAGNRIITAGQSVGELYGRLMLNSVDQKDPNGNPFIESSQQGNYTVASNGWVVDRTSKQPYLSPKNYSLGNPNPNFMMTFMSDFSYKKILTFLFQVDWLSGNRLYNETKQWMYRDGIHSDYEKPITIDGQTGAWSAFYRGAYAPGSAWYKNYFYEDASFVRLRNISFGVDFARIFKIKNLDKLQLILSGRNLWTYTKYTGMDPEINTFGANSSAYNFNTTLNRGVDSSSFPNLRTYQFTLIVGL